MGKRLNISPYKLEKLKNAVLITLGRQIETHSDCEILSEKILQKTDRSIGITTLRRFFGLDPAKNLPSPYTLDTLAIFSGYSSWQDIAEADTQYQQNISDIFIQNVSTDAKVTWEKLKSNSHSISQFNLKALKKKTGIAYEHAIQREFAIEQILSFLESNYSATAFIAPGGYGKSTLLSKAIEAIWFSETPVYKNDIVWFIDGSILNGFLVRGFDFSAWLAGQIGLNHSQNYREIFSGDNPPKGRMILVVDAVDEITQKDSQLREIILAILNLIASNTDTPWLKIILAMRNLTWNRFVHYHNNFPNIQNYWYNVPFRVYNEDFTNIPPLNTDEMLKIARNIRQNFDENIYEKLEEVILSGDFSYVLSYPLYFQMFIQLIQEKNAVPESETELFIEFIRTKISAGSFAEGKQAVIQAILEELDYGYKGIAAPKKKLMTNELFKNNSRAYHELLSFGILREYQHFNNFGVMSIHVQFGHKNLLEFLIATHYAAKDDKLSVSTFEFIFKRYQNNELKTEIIKWLIKLAFFQKEYDVVFNLNKLIKRYDYFTKEDKFQYFDEYWETIQTIGTALRHDNIAFDVLIPRFAADTNWQKWYFETFVDIDYLVIKYGKALWYYLVYNKTKEGQIFGHSLLLYKYILEAEYEEAKYEISILEKIDFDPLELHPLLLGRLMAFRAIYRYFFEGSLPKELLNSILEYEEQIHSSVKYQEFIPCYHATLIFALNLCKEYELTKLLWEKIYPKYDEYILKLRIPEIDLAKVFLANSYLETGELENGYVILNDYHENLYQTTRNSYGIYKNIIDAKFLFLLGDLERADKLMEEALIKTKKFGYKLLELFISRGLAESQQFMF
jgi:hypothetical protein